VSSAKHDAIVLVVKFEGNRLGLLDFAQTDMGCCMLDKTIPASIKNNQRVNQLSTFPQYLVPSFKLLIQLLLLFLARGKASSINPHVSTRP
jgi:hypothetical protein